MKLEKLTEKDTIVNDDKIGTVRCTRVTVIDYWGSSAKRSAKLMVRVDCYGNDENEYISVYSDLVDMPDSFHIYHALPLLRDEIELSQL